MRLGIHHIAIALLFIHVRALVELCGVSDVWETWLDPKL